MEFTMFLRIVLYLIIEKKLYTTFATRTLFMYSSIIYNSLGYIMSIKSTDGFNPSFIFELEPENIIYYHIHIFILGLSLLNTTFNSKILFDSISSFAENILIDNKYVDFKDKYQEELSKIEKELYEYYNLRDEDGWKDSNEQILIPNYKFSLKINDEQDLSNINQNSWILMENQIMIGSGWKNINGLLNEKVTELINSFILNEYKNIDKVTETNRYLKSINDISEEKKVIINFFDELLSNLTASGVLNYFLISYYENNLVPQIDQIKFFHILNCGLFQSSIVIYNTKYTILDPCPIQFVRQNFDKNFIPITSISEDSSCPSFISKDIGLISTGSNILKDIIGDNVQDLNIIMNSFELLEISSYFKQENPSLKINLASLIIPILNDQTKQIIGSNNIPLEISSWDDIIEYIWMIRYLGGVDSSYSNNYGVIIGKEIANLILEMFYK